MANKSTVKYIKPLTNYRGDVALYQLSKLYKKGKNSYKHVIVHAGGGLSGKGKVVVWLADEKGTIAGNLPILTYTGKGIKEAFEKLGYSLVWQINYFILTKNCRNLAQSG